MSSTPRSRYRNFNDLKTSRGSSPAANRHSSYIPPSQPLDVLSLLTPSAKSKYSSSTSISNSVGVPIKRFSSSSSVTKTVYSVKTSDGSEIKTSAPVKKNIFGRSSIYGALEAALTSAEEDGADTKKPDEPKNEPAITTVNEDSTETTADGIIDSGGVVYRRKLPGRSNADGKSEEGKGERQKSVSLDVEEAFPSLRSRIQTFDSLKSKATRRILPDTPAEEPKLTIRRVSFENAAKPESVCLKKESDDSGCDENSEDSPAGTPTPSDRVASVTSIDSLLGPGSPRTSSTSPDLVPKKLSNLAITEDKEGIHGDEDIMKRTLKDPLKEAGETTGRCDHTVTAVNLDDSLEFVTVEAPVKNKPLQRAPPDLLPDKGHNEVFERKFYTNEKLLEKKISNTKLISNDTSHVKPGGYDKMVPPSTKNVTKESTNNIKPSKINDGAIQSDTSSAFKDSHIASGPFRGNEKTLNKFLNNTKKANTTACIPIKSNETSDRNSFYRSEKRLDKKVSNTKPAKSDENTWIRFAESQKDNIGERFSANERVMNKLISNTRKTKTAESAPGKIVVEDVPNKIKPAEDEDSNIIEPANIMDSNEDEAKVDRQFHSNEKILNKYLKNTKRPETVASLPVEDQSKAKSRHEDSVQPAEDTKKLGIRKEPAEPEGSFLVNNKILNKYINNTKPPKVIENEPAMETEAFQVDDKILSKYVKNTKPPKVSENEPAMEAEAFQVNDKILNKYIKNTKPPKVIENEPVEKAEAFQVDNKVLDKYVKNTKPPKVLENEPVKEAEAFQVDDRILNKYINNTKPPKVSENEPVKEAEAFQVDDRILNKYINNTKPAQAVPVNDKAVDEPKPESKTITSPAERDEEGEEFRIGGKIFNRLLKESKQWESSPALMKTESFKSNESSLDKYVKNTKPPKTMSTSPGNAKTSQHFKEWEQEEIKKDPLNFSQSNGERDEGSKMLSGGEASQIPAVKKKTPPSDSEDGVKSWRKKPPLPSDDSSPVTPVSPLVAKIEVLATSPVSSSDESDADWKKKIMTSQNLLQRGISAPTLLRPLVATIMEGTSDVSDTEDVVGELPSFKPSGARAKFGRQYSTPVQSPRKEQSVPLQPARRRKSQVKTRKKAPVKLPELELEDNFDGLDDITSPVLQSPFKNAIRPNRRTTTSQNPVRLRQELEKQQKEQDEKENLLKKRTEPKNGAVSHWKKARLAASAINGLQMKIDFASAARGLRKTEKRADGTAKVSKAAGEESCVESKFPEKMLLLLKGRKNVQCALVECRVSSLNSGDVFLLLHKDELFHFVGQDANVHEKAKGNDLVERILRNKEMGCTATKCTSLHEKDMDMSNRSFKRFFELLEGRPPIAEKESFIEDKEFERRFQQEAKISVYEEDEDSPTFVQLNTGKRLRYEILDSKKTFVLDFITEYYIWCGKGVPLSTRKKALLLAEEEYKRSVAECPKNPIVPPQGRRASVAMTAGALPSTEVSRRISCASRGSVDMPSSVKLARRTSTTSNKNQLTQRSISSDNVHTNRRVSVSVNSRGTISKVNSESNLRRMSSASGSSGGERRQSVASQGRRMSTASRRSSVASNGRGSLSRRSSVMSTSSQDSSGGTRGRRVSVSMKQLRSLVTGSGKRMKTEEGAIQVERAEWGINTVTIQGKEPISLREKFSDWPEPGRIIKMKGHAASDDQNPSVLAPSQPLEPYDAELMHRPQPAEEILKLELTKLGRGRGTFKSFDEEITVITDDVKTWLVHEYKNYVLPSSYNHMLYASEGYVVRWEYHMEVFDGFVRKHKSKRCAYYFWQGVECEINMKGATALMTVELDKEKGPQIRVVQNREPPSFLNLFNGKLVVRTDKRQMLGREPNLGRRVFPTETEMYVVRGECVEEGHLHQIEARVRSLRSRGCFIVVAPNQTVYVWLGSKSTPHAREVAQKAGNEIEDNYISDNFRVVVVHESKEPRSFFSSLGDHEDYCPLTSSIDSHIYTPRLFRFDSTSGKFIAEELLCKHRVPDRDTQFPFIQDDLYGVNQPALFLLDAKYQLWLWQGWFETSEDSEKVTGSARQTFARNKKVAMETVNNYVEEMMLAENPKVFPIEAGYEPVDFITLFPFWTEREDVKRYGNKEIAAKGAGGRRTSINTAYKMLTRTEYTLEELQVETKPEGVDPSRLEDYLSEEEFMKVFEMHREEFKGLAKWKQVVLKQRKKLY